jgi:hypothetical protein
MILWLSSLLRIGCDTSPALLVSRRMSPVAVDIAGACPRQAVSPVMPSTTVATPQCFFARPREVAQPLASVASLLLHLVRFDAPDLSLSTNRSIVDDLFGCVWCVEPYF